ncbi:GNAT family N-acetyltransferase [Paenibacillus arenilitoris]|uniref:GNAT family N-acetyltransferase n=1 Tax=Paenibacillus arenilitoris TaxID=2772299 RepID=A0A927CRK5_9BACL|nr:GNAT family N-acetyltransferase [Paenibacillus arenilitoris]MBD2870626.1 GNAT family N-acetyltransferase [Paenibacillus arenilitoris]
MIRLADAKDAYLVHKIMLLAFEEYRNIDVPSSALNETIDSIEASIKKGYENALLYFSDEIPLGSVRFKTEDDSLYFSRLSVSPEARGRGIAKSILSWLEDYAKKNGKSEIICRVRMSIPQNIQLYKSVGFIVAKEEVVTNPNGFPVKTVVMKKVIS